MCRNGSTCGCGGKGGGIPVALLMAVAVVVALVVFVATHAGIVGRAAVSFISVMAIVVWLIWRSRRVAHPRRVVHPPVLKLGTAPRAIRAVPQQLDPPPAGHVAGPAERLAISPRAVVHEDVFLDVVERRVGSGDGAGRRRAGKRRFGHSARMPR